MLRQLNFRDRLVAMTIVPILVVAVIAAGLLIFVNTTETRPYGIFALSGVLVAGAAAYLVGRSVLAAIDELTAAATDMADAHRKLAAGELSADEVPTVPITSDDEIARLAAAMNAINAASIEAAESNRSAVKEGLSNIVVNLARRSQTLLDRQVEYLDKLESTEEDPERLGELFKVDHLATRMRRNAESLMVLAEADPGRRRGGPVDIADVLRVSMGEVENYEHIELKDVDEGQVGAGAAVDLAHLIAELMENATQFSPPNTAVEVVGNFETAERFVITISDQGMGLTEEKLTNANEVLANPPELGLAMGRSLGFMVIGRLAQRLDTSVELEAQPQGGTKAIVSIPTSLFATVSSAAPAVGTTSTESATTDADEAGGAATSAEASSAGADTDADADADTGTGSGTSGSTDADDADKATDSAGDPAPGSDGEASSDDPDEAAADAGDVPEASSAALAKLLGINAKKQDAAQAKETTTPADWASTSPFGDQPSADDSSDESSVGSWTPPSVTPGPAAEEAAPAKLEEAVPSGEAFETGVASLLDERPSGRDLLGDQSTSTGLTKRQRGASQIPIGEGRPVAASTRDPNEIRSMLSKYREGVKSGKDDAVDDAELTDDLSGELTDERADDKDAAASANETNER